MKVVFHADDRPQSGLGHVVRTRALAAAFRERGHEPLFVSAPGMEAQSASLIVVDSYAVTGADIARWSRNAPVCVIDDLGDRDLSPAAAILNQNFGASPQRYAHVPMLLLGPAYALLRDQFRETRPARTFGESDRRVLITLGGGEVTPQLDELAAALKKLPRELDVVTLGGRSRQDDVAAMMADADLAVSGGGVTTLELAALGTPAIVTTLAANQEPGAAAMAAAGLAILAGPLEHALPLIPGAVERLLRDAGERERMSRRMTATVDGNGAQRAADALETIARK